MAFQKCVHWHRHIPIPYYMSKLIQFWNGCYRFCIYRKRPKMGFPCPYLLGKETSLEARVIAPGTRLCPAPFKPFNDCPPSLKGGANLEDETASATEKRLKNPKNKTAESVERLISTHFCGFPLYQFRCCNVPLLLRLFS